jgi:hypothetical protein
MFCTRCDDCAWDCACRDIILFTQGKDMIGGSLSFYLNVPDHPKLASGWARRQSFMLIIEDQLDASKSVVLGEPLGGFPHGMVGN